MADGGSEEAKKFNVTDAMEALKKRRIEKDVAAIHAPPPDPQQAQRPGFIAPQFWLDNLQDGVQRSRDRLFDNIAENPNVATGLGRRDFTPTQGFVIPEHMLIEVGGAEENRQMAEELEDSPLKSAAIHDAKVLGEAGLTDEKRRLGEG
jgi:hypothetical protein